MSRGYFDYGYESFGAPVGGRVGGAYRPYRGGKGRMDNRRVGGMDNRRVAGFDNRRGGGMDRRRGGGQKRGMKNQRRTQDQKKNQKSQKRGRRAPSVPVANLILLSGDAYKGSEHKPLNGEMDPIVMNTQLNCGTNNFHLSLSIQHNDWQNEGKGTLELEVPSKDDILGFHVCDIPEEEVASQKAEFDANFAELEALKPKKEEEPEKEEAEDEPMKDEEAEKSPKKAKTPKKEDATKEEPKEGEEPKEKENEDDSNKPNGVEKEAEKAKDGDAEKTKEGDAEKAKEKSKDKKRGWRDPQARRPYKYRGVLVLKSPLKIRLSNEKVMSDELCKEIRVIIMEFRDPIGDGENKMSAVIAKALGEGGPLEGLDATTVWGGPKPKVKKPKKETKKEGEKEGEKDEDAEKEKDAEKEDDAEDMEDDAEDDEPVSLEEANQYMNIVVDEFIAISRDFDRKNSEITKCPFGCERHMNLRRLNRHKLSYCQFRPSKCRYCSEEFPRNQLVEHQQSECPKYKIPCKNGGQYGCKLRPERETLDEHIAVCDHELVDCEYLEFGCEERIKRKNVNAHSDVKVSSHLKHVVEKYKNMATELAEIKQALIKKGKKK